MKIITGNPGTGKHTIANLVSKKLDLELIDVNKLAISKGLFQKSEGVLDVDVKKLKKIIDKMISKNLLLVGHLAPYVVSAKKVELAIVLRKSPYLLQTVYKKRKYSPAKAIENLGSEILGIIYYDTLRKFGKKKTVQIDTTSHSIQSTTKKVTSVLLGKKRKSDSVDWLELVLKKGDMRRFFPY